MAFCHKCGKKLPSEAIFCPACGASVSTTPGTTAPLTLAQPTGAMANYATLGDRAVAVIIDSFLLFLAALVFLVLLIFIPGIGALRMFGLGFGLLFGPLVIAPWVLSLIYFTYFESTSGQTLGKGMVGIKVVDETSQRPR